MNVKSLTYKKIQIGNKLILEHRYLMEQKIGRKLHKDEVVHHINRDITDNRLDNLQLLTRSEHSKLHTPDSIRNRGCVMKRINMYLSEDDMNFLKTLPGNYSEHVRRAVDDYINELLKVASTSPSYDRKERRA